MDETADFDTPRSASAIARRAIALHCAIAAAHGVSRDDIGAWLKQEQLWSELTPGELKFIEQAKLPREQIIRMMWLVEAQATLLWAIQKLHELPLPTQVCDSALIVAAMPALFEPTSAFLASARLRDAAEIVREEENIYAIHCRVDQARRQGQAMPHGYHKDVVFFRHYGLSWVRGYCGQDWDDVTPDT